MIIIRNINLESDNPEKLRTKNIQNLLIKRNLIMKYIESP